MKKTRRFLALLLSLSMAFTLFGGTVSMADESSAESSEEEASVTASGECGDNLTWILDEEGTLTISGTGDMWDFDNDGSPWFGYISYITSIVIEEGATSIGSWAFDDCYWVTTISIPTSVTRIDYYAFWCVGDATEGYYFTINYAGTANQWNSISFDYDDKLAYAYAVVYASDGTCINYEELTVGEASSSRSVEYANGYRLWYYFTCEESGFYEIITADSDGYGTYLDLYDDTRSWLSDSWLYWDGRKSEANLVYYYEAGETYVIEAGDAYGGNTFNITIAINKVDSIYDGFAETVSIDTAGDVAFYTFTPEETNYYCFGVCADGDNTLASITDINQNQLIGDWNNQSENVYISYLLEEGETYLFIACIYDGSVTGELSVSLNSYDTSGQCGDDLYWAFDISSGTLTISGTGDMWDFGEGGTPWYDIKDWICSIVIEDGVESIGDCAFRGCDVSSITIPSSVTYIGGSIMNSSDGEVGGITLDSITFEGDAPGFDDGAFDCVNTIVYYPAGNDTWTDDVKQDYGGTITWASVDSDGNVSIDEDGLSGQCGDYLYWSLDLETGILSITGRGEMWDYGRCFSPWFALRDYITGVEITEKCTSIGENAFYGCSGITEITIPANVIDIGFAAFELCTSLETVSIESAELYIIDAYAFDQCYALETVTIESTELYSIGDSAFFDCYSLTEIDIPAVNIIDCSAFGECYALETVNIHSGLYGIVDFAFYSCYSLSEINIPDGVNYIGNYAFGQCYSLTGIDLPETLVSIGRAAFEGSGLTSIVLPDSLTELGEIAFNNCSDLVEVTIGEGLTYIPHAAFQGTALVDVVIPDSVESIGSQAFSLIYTLESVTIGENVSYIGDIAFHDSGVWCDEITAEYSYMIYGSAYDQYGNWVYDFTQESDAQEWYYSGRTLTVTFTGDAIIGEDEWGSYLNVEENIFSSDCYVTVYYNADSADDAWVSFAQRVGNDMGDETLTVDGTEASWNWTYGSSIISYVHADHEISEGEADEDGTVEYTCTICGEVLGTETVPSAGTAVTYADGLNYDTSSDTWGYYSDGEIDTGYTGLVTNGAGTWYVVEGIVDFSYTGIVEDTDGTVYYVKASRVLSYTGLYKIDGTWYYLEEGALALGYIGLAENVSGTWYISGGTVDFDYTGFVEIGGDTYYVSEGLVNMSDGPVKIGGTWYYMEDGVIDLDYTGFATNSSGTWYFEDGTLSFSYTGFVEDADGNLWYVSNSKVKTDTGLTSLGGTWYYLEEGIIITDYTGLAENSYGTWYLEDGTINFDYTGLYTDGDGTSWYISNGKLKDITSVYKVDGVWYCFVSGAVDYSYTGLASNTSGTWYVEEGIVSLSYTGLYTDDDGVTWYIVGSAVSSKSGVLKVDGTWYYIVDGVVQYDYTGLASNSSGTWYVEDGVVTFTYNGTVTIDGTTYTIVNSKVS